MTQIAQHPYSAPVHVQQQQYNPSVPYATTLYTAAGSPVQIVNVNSGVSDGTYQGYKAPAAKILGLLQITLGLIVMISQIILTAIHSEGYQGFSGFWASIVFIIAGAFGVQSAKTKSQCAVVTTLVMSIIAAVLSIGPITQGSAGAAMQYTCYDYGYHNDYGYGCRYHSRHRVGVAFHALMIFCGIAEGIVAIIAAAYCCHGCCCYSRPGVVLNQHGGMAPLPLVSGQMQVTTVQYHPPPNQGYNQVYYPTPAPAPAPVGPSAYPAQAGALPAYSASAPPPQYSEKV